MSRPTKLASIKRFWHHPRRVYYGRKYQRIQNYRHKRQRLKDHWHRSRPAARSTHRNRLRTAAKTTFRYTLTAARSTSTHRSPPFGSLRPRQMSTRRRFCSLFLFSRQTRHSIPRSAARPMSQLTKLASIKAMTLTHPQPRCTHTTSTM